MITMMLMLMLMKLTVGKQAEEEKGKGEGGHSMSPVTTFKDIILQEWSCPFIAFFPHIQHTHLICEHARCTLDARFVISPHLYKDIKTMIV